jgi:hypothetical protein
MNLTDIANENPWISFCHLLKEIRNRFFFRRSRDQGNPWYLSDMFRGNLSVTARNDNKRIRIVSNGSPDELP